MLNKQIKTPDRTEQTQSQIKNETETQTTATQDMTTRDLIAPGVRTADEHHTQVFAETVESLQATISEPRVQYFPSDLYEAQFDPACIELLPNCRDPIKISDQITCQESKYSLCDFDAGPPLKTPLIRVFHNSPTTHHNPPQLTITRHNSPQVPEVQVVVATTHHSLLS